LVDYDTVKLDIHCGR